jgi:hypothetical protein
LFMKLLHKKVVVLFMARRYGKQWSNCSFPPLIHKKTIVFLSGKRGGGQCSKLYFLAVAVSKMRTMRAT